MYNVKCGIACVYAGLCEQWDERDGLQGLRAGRLRWSEVVDHMSIAKASEYSRED
jgi:hypothetical protein